jgi:hypothetical protein
LECGDQGTEALVFFAVRKEAPVKALTNWDHLRPFGIDALTGEACGLGYRLLCDLTARGKAIVEKCLGTPALTLFEQWNPGNKDDPQVGCILLVPEMCTPLAVFAVLESGYQECWASRDGRVYALDPDDPQDAIEAVRRWLGVEGMRRFCYRGSADDRNVHVMSGRTA